MRTNWPVKLPLSRTPVLRLEENPKKTKALREFKAAGKSRYCLHAWRQMNLAGERAVPACFFILEYQLALPGADRKWKTPVASGSHWYRSSCCRAGQKTHRS
jgi:hypothetical protein